MRVALIAPPWVAVPPPAYGGTELVLDLLGRGLMAAGHDVMLFTTGDSTSAVPRSWVHPHAETLRMGLALPEIEHVIHAYQHLEADIVHDHTLVGPIYAKGRPGLPVVTTNHGPFNAELLTLYRDVVDRVPVIAISRNQASAAVDLPVVRVIHHGLDAGIFPAGEGDGGYFAFLGRMAPEKGARRAALIARATGVRLLIAAKMREPWEVQYFEDQVRPLLTSDVEFVGEVGPADKAALLAGATALINPIRWAEPFGLVMVEALACGTPVLAYKEGAAPEIVEHGATGFLCDDERDMIQRVGEVGLLDRKACRRAVETHFSVERMVREHVEVYEEVIARTRG
jgi:glycosyltransferase involved in cell wall biosynthesis